MGEYKGINRKSKYYLCQFQESVANTALKVPLKHSILMIIF